MDPNEGKKAYSAPADPQVISTVGESANAVGGAYFDAGFSYTSNEP